MQSLTRNSGKPDAVAGLTFFTQIQMKSVSCFLLAALTGILPLTATGNGPATRPPVPKRAPAPLFIALLPPPTGPLLSQVPALPSSGLADRPVRDIAPLLNQLPVVGVVDLGSLKPALGVQPRYVAVGGSLTAGFRNGGPYREAQLTAYPNLIARQMGLADFRQPLFSPEQGNGSGYKQLVPGGAFVQYTDVANNVASVGKDPLTFGPVSGRVDNLGMPFLGVHSSRSTESWRLDSRTGPGVPYQPEYRSYFRRLLPNDNSQWTANYVGYVLQQKADFMTIELGVDDAIWFATAGGYRLNGVMTQLAMGESSPVITLLNHLTKNQMKGAIATVPDVLRFPYFSFVPAKTARQRNGGQKLYAVVDDRYELVENGAQYVAEIADTDILLPTADVMALAQGISTKKGLSVATPLSSHDVLSARDIADLRHVDDLNSLIRFQAAKAKVPVVDLAAIYKRILAGQYTTDDGLKIDPSFPGGNFFSGDGLHPTALGQAVIANEWIRVINGYYQTKIPLIATAQFAQRLK